MKKLFEVLAYISFFAAVVATIIAIIAHFADATPLGTTPRGVAIFAVLCLIWFFAFDFMEKRLVKKGD